MSSLDDKTLQRFYDGDLDDEERTAVEAQLEQSAEDRQRLASLTQMSQLLQANLGGAAEEAALDGLWDRVKADLPDGSPATERESAWARFRAWLGDSMGTHPMRWVGGGAVAAAAAVAITLLLIPDPKPSAPTLEHKALYPSDNVDIDEIDTPNRHPDIYQIKNGMRTTTVIWVHDDDEYDDDEPGTDGANDGDDI